MILKARVVLTMDGPPIADGMVVTNGDTIVAVGRQEEVEGLGEPGPVVDLGALVLLPGLINAHCHLDYSTLRYAITYTGSFTAWVRRINAVKRTLSDDDYLEAIRRGFRELLRWGTTSVCNVESFPELMNSLPEPPLRTWWFYEMIDIRHRITTKEVVRGALSFFQSRRPSLNHFGLSPHSPYTASGNLYALANHCADTYLMMLTTHVGESNEEMEMFCRAQGPLYDFLRSIGRPMEDCGGHTPLQRLWESGAVNERWLLVHLNELAESDFELLAHLPPERRPHLVHCPGSHAYFRHTPFPYARLADLGMNICLGTDSLASTNTLSLFDEMRRCWLSEPWLTPEQVLQTVTLNPARALRRAGQLGIIKNGALADLIALPYEEGLGSVYEQVINFRQPVPWMMIDGKICAN